jgi:acetolactate synthase-1/3 small subunit
MKHTIVALMEDHPGVLNRVVSMFRRRNFNIESLTVGHTDQAGISRMTIVVDGTDLHVEQVTKQMHKIVDVLKITDLTAEKSVISELSLIKVSTNNASRSEIIQLVDIYKARIVDVSADSLMLEVTGPEEKIDSLINLMRPFGIKEMVRTGRVAMVRGASNNSRVSDDDLDVKFRPNSRQSRVAV